MCALLELCHPRSKLMIVALEMLQHRSRTVDEKSTYVRVATFADSEQGGFPSGCPLAWNQTEPRREFSAFAEPGSVADRSDQCGRTEWSDTRNSDESPAVVVAFCDEFDLMGTFIDLRLKSLPMLTQPRYQLTHSSG